MNLVIDIGNTLQKCAIFDSSDKELFFDSLEEISVKYLNDLFLKFQIQNAIFSSVGKQNIEVLGFLNEHTNCIVFDHHSKLPITIDYTSIETLGLDRIANGVGVASIFPGENCLSIQAGTCIVYDFIDKNGVFQGGAISPGINMRFEALHTQTKNLPLLEKENVNYFIGKNTQQSIKSGVINGVIFEIKGQIDLYKTQFDPLNVVLTGGDMFFLQNSIKNQIFATPNLVLSGLNKILKLNV
jgi:type III pantothenate kinase